MLAELAFNITWIAALVAFAFCAAVFCIALFTIFQARCEDRRRRRERTIILVRDGLEWDDGRLR